jgi:hypothetical protein
VFRRLVNEGQRHGVLALPVAMVGYALRLDPLAVFGSDHSRDFLGREQVSVIGHVLSIGRDGEEVKGIIGGGVFNQGGPENKWASVADSRGKLATGARGPFYGVGQALHPIVSITKNRPG